MALAQRAGLAGLAQFHVDAGVRQGRARYPGRRCATAHRVEELVGTYRD